MSAARTVCHVSTFGPTQCGIATYVRDVIEHLPNWCSVEVRLLFLSDQPLDRTSSDALTIVVDEAPRSAYERLADAVNRVPCHVVSLQHEFGIFGGTNGEYVIDFVGALTRPLVSTLHTISPDFSSHQLDIVASIVENSRWLVVLSSEDADVLANLVPEAASKTRVVSHGVPEISFVPPARARLRKSLEADLVFVSAGHIRPSKGYHLALEALARFRETHPNFHYLLLGQVQPQYTKNYAYRRTLVDLIDQFDLANHVTWIEEFLPWPSFIEHIQAADVGLVTYTESEQASSGVLPLFLAAGRPVVATPFAYSVRAAARLPGISVSVTCDSRGVLEAILSLPCANELRRTMSNIHASMRPYSWRNVTRAYDQIFDQI